MNFSTKESKINKGMLTVIPVTENLRNEILAEKLSDFSISSRVFSAKKDSTLVFEREGKLLLLLGLGTDPEYKTIETSFRRVIAKNHELVENSIHLDFYKTFDSAVVEAAVTGLMLGNYQLDFYKKERKKNFENLEIAVLSTAKNLENSLDRAQKIGKAKIEAFSLVDLPPNKVTPEFLADWAASLARIPQVNVTIYDQKMAKELGLEAFLAVSRGSAKPPKFIVIEYRHPQAKKHIGLVGKGVTFDTGGLNVKTQGMHYMKSDMGGAATVLAATQLIGELGLPINLTTIVPSVENAIDKNAYLPSEVIGSHAGLSIEIVDTDAEGRLILADGLSYLVKNYQVDTLLDFATLTGSAVGTFGYESAALFSNDEQLSQEIQKLGMLIDEKAWPLPIWDVYGKEMDSEIADIRNFHGKPIAGAITAAKFLQAFIHEHPSWAHLDIAGVAFGDGEFSKSKSGTAYGVHLLLKFIENQL
ncbi:leucyl aminopeptidase family protein [Algoriphagus hitonicola]|uniref:Leucyl aminopeptidase n=1 Tax=Algoriphagus hitonicola TaxID=435880 RepID=A0A1I2TN27_9BACT|nr:leucyl aminopeptidase family protein [Algoriphagus hitonicola]SFG66365.1 leucyl aminopeptidase [Algoriphagus hitonicola]